MKLTAKWISNPETQMLFQAFEDAGFALYFVGGCVRNAILGYVVADIDLATSATPDEMIEIAKERGMRILPTGIEHGTMTFVVKGSSFEVTTFRADIETDGRHATVAFSTRIEEDAKRRDLTMNALYADAHGVVIDPLDGMQDLEAQHVRFIGDPETRIQEDYLRILRFFRFFATYGDLENGIDPEGLAACAAHADGLARVSKERIGQEFRKILAADDPSQAVSAMAASLVLSQCLVGADAKALPRLVHFENIYASEIDPILRLAVLVQDAPRDALRLSRAETRAFERFRQFAVDHHSGFDLGYQLGKTAGIQAVLLRAALTEIEPNKGIFQEIEAGATAIFPIKAQDLLHAYQGPELGICLKKLERSWITSQGQKSKDELLSELR